MEELNKREAHILAYMKTISRQQGYPPTVREICTELGIKSTSTVHRDLAELERKGYIRKNPSKPRAIEILAESGESVPAQSGQGSLLERADIIDIPLVGRIAAGTPILAEQNVEDSFPIPARFINSGDEHFMLTVRGDSMIEAGIFSGDYILVQAKKEARNGDIVVAMIDGFESEATVKTYYREADHIRLQPENQSMSPIIVKDVSILGLVKGVFRYF